MQCVLATLRIAIPWSSSKSCVIASHPAYSPAHTGTSQCHRWASDTSCRVHAEPTETQTGRRDLWVVEGGFQRLARLGAPKGHTQVPPYEAFDLSDVGADLCVRPGQRLPMQKSDAHPMLTGVSTSLGELCRRIGMEYQEPLSFSKEEHPFGIPRASTGQSPDSHTFAQQDRRARVLCIGSVLGTLVTLKLVLEHFCEVDVVADITAALRLLSGHPPSLLFMHTSLPTLDGTRLLQLMRIGLPDCPVILISDTDASSPPSPEFSSLPTYTFIGAPHRFNELLRATTALLPAGRNPAGLPRSLSLHVTKALCYIGIHYAENLTVRKLGNEIGVSEGYLAHLFRVEVQMGVKAFIMRVRIEVAKQLLCNQSYTLEHIAEELGFSDASHLSCVFRQFSGCPPSVYRREMRRS